VVAGISPASLKIADSINKTSGLGLKVLGLYDDVAPPKEDLEQAGHRHLGSLQDLVRDARVGAFDLVYINLPPEEHEKIRELTSRLADTTVSVYYILPASLTASQLAPQWQFLNGVNAVSIYESPFVGVSSLVKRIEDILLSSLILAVIALPMLFIAIALKLTSRGPVFFMQMRYGIRGRRFKMIKFRSMTVMDDGSVVKQATRGDARVTRFGGFLRRHSLDELPQFLNVLLGDMSIVGPRPHAVAHNEEFRLKIEGYMMRHKVYPGITGLAQISGCRGETDTLEKMKRRVAYDLAYVRTWSIWLDLKIILITLFRGFRDDQAY